MTEQIDHDRMNDDGGPPHHERERAGIIAQSAGTPADNWDAYCAWRRTKTPVRDLKDPAQAMEEMDQAIHEFVGEVAELSELFQQGEIRCYLNPTARSKVIDEAGDILFCGCWVLDAWRRNPLEHTGQPLVFQPRNTDSFGAQIADSLRRGAVGPRESEIVGQLTTILLNRMLTSAGLLSNSFKKLKFQKRDQNADIQATRVLKVFKALDGILWNCDSSIQEALRYNVEKLDARYPDGHQTGGGIREKGLVLVP